MTTSHDNSTAQPKRRRKFLAGLLTGTALGGMLAAGVAAFSHAPGGWHGQHFGHGGHHGRFADNPEAMAERAEFATDWMLKKVNATEPQRQQIKSIIKSALTDLMPLREQHHASHKAALEILKQPSIDRQALENIRRTELERAEQASQRIVQALADVADILTPQQRQELAQRFTR